MQQLKMRRLRIKDPATSYEKVSGSNPSVTEDPETQLKRLSNICWITFMIWSIVVLIFFITMLLIAGTLATKAEEKYSGLSAWFPYFQEEFELMNIDILNLRKFKFQKKFTHKTPFDPHNQNSFDYEIVPPSRKGSCCATTFDHGTFCFGGMGSMVIPGTLERTTLSVFNDFWMFQDNKWFFLQGVYEIGKGKNITKNAPEGRAYASCWLTKDKTFYLLGGEDAAGNSLKDFWSVSVNDRDIGNLARFNSLKSVFHDKWKRLVDFSIPISHSHYWRDIHDKFWIYGGLTIENRPLNSIWVFDQNQWSLEKGSENGSECLYPSQQSGNEPNCKTHSLIWQTKHGFKIYGGYERWHSHVYESDDLWEYNIGLRTWTQHLSKNRCKASYENTKALPGCRSESTTWLSGNGELWLWGGVSNNTLKSDLWSFSVKTKQWNWNGGYHLADFPGYVNRAKPYLNVPPSRLGTSHWIEDDGLLYLAFGQDYNNNLYSSIWNYKIQ